MDMSSAKTDQLSRASRETLLARKIKQAEEGRTALTEYRRDQQNALDNMAILRAQRLARDAASPAPKNVVKLPDQKVTRAKVRRS